MTIDTFWELLEGLDSAQAVDELATRLEKLSAEEIIDFDAHFIRAFRHAYDWRLWAAAYLIEGGCSDDGFMDFRYGLLSRGRRVFELALSDPDSLPELLGEEDFVSNEEFGYVATRVFEAKTGEEAIPSPDLPPIGEPTGQRWDFDDPVLCAQKLPRIWQRYGHTTPPQA